MATVIHIRKQTPEEDAAMYDAVDAAVRGLMDEEGYINSNTALTLLSKAVLLLSRFGADAEWFGTWIPTLLALKDEKLRGSDGATGPLVMGRMANE